MVNISGYRQSNKLRSGIPITFYKKEGSPIALRVTFFAGSRFDPKGKEGLAHFVEHMFFENKSIFPSRTELSEFFENFGGSISAITKLDTIQFDLKVSNYDDLKVALPIFTKFLNNREVDREALERERVAITSEIKKKNSVATEIARRNIYSRIFGEANIARPTAGTLEGINSITADDIKEFISKRFTQQNVSIIAAGDLKDDFLNLCESCFPDFLNANQSVIPEDLSSPILLNDNSGFEILENNNMKEVTVGIFFKTDGISSSDGLVLELISYILAGSPSSLLYKKLRFEEGLIYKVDSIYTERSDYGLFSIWTSCSSLNTKAVVDSIASQISVLKQSAIDNKYLEEIKNRFLKKDIFDEQRVESVIENNAYRQLFDENFDYDNSREAIAKITPIDITNVLNKYFISENTFGCLLGPVSDEDKVYIKKLKIG